MPHQCEGNQLGVPLLAFDWILRTWKHFFDFLKSRQRDDIRRQHPLCFQTLRTSQASACVASKGIACS
jgi:hypothetical protein